MSNVQDEKFVKMPRNFLSKWNIKIYKDNLTKRMVWTYYSLVVFSKMVKYLSVGSFLLSVVFCHDTFCWNRTGNGSKEIKGFVEPIYCPFPFVD